MRLYRGFEITRTADGFYTATDGFTTFSSPYSDGVRAAIDIYLARHNA